MKPARRDACWPGWATLIALVRFALRYWRWLPPFARLAFIAQRGSRNVRHSTGFNYVRRRIGVRKVSIFAERMSMTTWATAFIRSLLLADLRYRITVQCPAALVAGFVNWIFSYRFADQMVENMKWQRIRAGCENVAISFARCCWPISGYCFVAISNFAKIPRGRDVMNRHSRRLNEAGMRRPTLSPSHYRFNKTRYNRFRYCASLLPHGFRMTSTRQQQHILRLISLFRRTRGSKPFHFRRSAALISTFQYFTSGNRASKARPIAVINLLSRHRTHQIRGGRNRSLYWC